MAYADPNIDTAVQLPPGGKTLALGVGAVLGADAGSKIDLGGVAATSLLDSVAEGLTAGTTQTQAGGLAITAVMNRFTTVANNGDACTLPVSVPGASLTIINAGGHSLQVFPNAGGTTTETINALAANAAFSMAVAKVATFYCTLAGQWHSILSA